MTNDIDIDFLLPAKIENLTSLEKKHLMIKAQNILKNSAFTVNNLNFLTERYLKDKDLIEFCEEETPILRHQKLQEYFVATTMLVEHSLTFITEILGDAVVGINMLVDHKHAKALSTKGGKHNETAYKRHYKAICTADADEACSALGFDKEFINNAFTNDEGASSLHNVARTEKGNLVSVFSMLGKLIGGLNESKLGVAELEAIQELRKIIKKYSSEHSKEQSITIKSQLDKLESKKQEALEEIIKDNLKSKAEEKLLINEGVAMLKKGYLVK
jgi:hypothetical protein